ncbi:hypothetical protein NW762_012542 [Fusarium torreyae]|uniref:F-box domain-containing protein n=1 Tax=Fusarium torreyae TaxID=1237075 RepID=A0A9W8RNT4_9HYPO|nr:hypothetical protein NW762_012542 [Fusarium torreyae]
MAGPPPRLETLPLDLVSQIGDYIKASKLDGVSRASKRLRRAFARSMFYSVSFSGDQKRLSLMLEGFLHVSVIVRSGEDDDDSARNLGTLIIRALGKITKLSALNLDAWRLSPTKERQMCLQLEQTLHWPDLQSLRIEASLEVLKLLSNNIPPGSLKAMHLSQGINCPHLEIVKERYPQVKKLNLLLYRPPSEKSTRQYHSVEDQSDSIVQSIHNNFENLEWLVLTQIYHGMDFHVITVPSHLEVGSVLYQYEEIVSNLTKDLEKMKHLRRFALSLPRDVLLKPIFPHGTGDKHVLEGRARSKIRILIGLLRKRLPKLQQICFIDYTSPKHVPLIYRGTRIAEGEELTIGGVEPYCHRDAFPRGLLY